MTARAPHADVTGGPVRKLDHSHCRASFHPASALAPRSTDGAGEGSPRSPAPSAQTLLRRLLRLPRQAGRPQPLRARLDGLPLCRDLGPNDRSLLLPLRLLGGFCLSPPDGSAIALVHVRSSGCSSQKLGQRTPLAPSDGILERKPGTVRRRRLPRDHKHRFHCAQHGLRVKARS
jgi:hypothetical protein